MELDGVLLVDKSENLTSHDVVEIIRRKFKLKKVGHSGTLDPGATGLLILLLGQATKKSSYFFTLDKIYSTILTLGIKTTTADQAGIIIQEKRVPDYTREHLIKVFKSFTGTITQIPPMYSAKKIGGKKLYELAHRGIEIKRQPNTIKIKNLKITEIKLPFVNFLVRCTKGTYVRTLCEDIGEALGCGAHMSALRRLFCGRYKVENALTIDKILTLDNAALAEKVVRL